MEEEGEIDADMDEVNKTLKRDMCVLTCRSWHSLTH